MAAGVKRTMRDVRISSRALSALSSEVEKGFEQRLLRFLATHAPGFRPEPESIWRGYERSARLVGLVTEQEIVLFVYGCYLLGDDIAALDWDFFERTAEVQDADHRLVLIEERVLAFGVAREMIER